MDPFYGEEIHYKDPEGGAQHDRRRKVFLWATLDLYANKTALFYST